MNNSGHTNGNFRNGSGGEGVREISLRDLFATILRGKWIILLVTFLVFDVFLIKTLREEPMYEAKTSVIISTSGQRSPLGFFVDGGRNIVNEIEVLKSRSLAQQVAERLTEQRYKDDQQEEVLPILLTSPDESGVIRLANLESVTARVQRSVAFSQVPGTNIIQVAARSSDRVESAAIANTYADVYHKRNFEASRSQSVGVRQFLGSQLREREQSLKEAENNLQRYMEREGIVIVDAESRRVINQIAQLEARSEELDVAINSLTNTINSLKEQLTIQEPGIARNIGSADNPYINRLQQDIANMELERDRVLAQNPDAVGHEAYNARLGEIENRIKNLRTTLQNRTQEFLQELSPGDEGFLRSLKQRIIEGEIELQGFRIQKSAITNQLSEYERQFNQLPQVNMEFARLQRAQLSNEKLYISIEEKYNEAVIAEQSEFGSVGILDPALVPWNPVSPNIQFNLTIGLILGLIAGVGVVFLKEALTTKIKNPEELRKEGFSTLGIIALMYKDVRRITRLKRISMFGRSIDAFLITVSDPLSPISEAFRGIRTNLQYSQVDKQIQTLMITSANPGEGKSIISANLASTYAQAGKKVLLIDADMRKPTQHQIFDLAKKPGLTSVLFGELSVQDAVQHTVVDNLDVLVAGSIPSNPADLLGSKKMGVLLETLKLNYELIIFDSPPVLAATDPSILGTIVDGVVTVVSTQITKMDELKTATESIESVQGKILGIVLNHFDRRGSYGTSYAQRYYRYGSYGQTGSGLQSRSRIYN